jgi:hypothetical protein
VPSELLLLAGLGGMVAVWIGARARHYRRLFAPAHYHELAVLLPAAAAAALERADGQHPGASPDDPCVIVTSARLAVFLTIRREGDTYVHHVSVSIMGRYTPHTLGRTFVVFVAERLGWPLGQAEFAYSREGVAFHGELRLDGEAQRAWTRRGDPPALTDDVHAQALARAEAVTFAALGPLV